MAACMITRMNRQSRASRWLRVLGTVDAIMESTLESMGYFKSHGRRGIPVQGQMLLIMHGSDPITLAAEADPPVAGTDLAVRLKDVIAAAANMRVGDGFVPGIEALRAAIKDVLPTLQATIIDEVDSAEDIVTELERSLMVSVILSMTAHTTTQKWVNEWEVERQQFLRGRGGEPGHYRSMRATNIPSGDNNRHDWFSQPSFYANEPGPGRVHMQHLVAAINSGANVVVAGARGMKQVDHYPELQGIQYGQWFAYMHSIWNEQFRGRLAEYWSRGLPEDKRYVPNDIKNDFFGDIRLIRNDFVHNKGEADESTNLKTLKWKFKAGKQMEIGFEMMIDLIERFPRAELLTPPPPKEPAATGTKQKRVNMPGSGEAELVETFLATVKAKQFNKGKAIDEMLSDWIAKHEI